MEFLVPFMPLFATLPIAVAAVIVARLWFRHRDQQDPLARRVEDLETEVAALRHGQVELQERAEFSERLLGQLRERPGIPRGGD